jgi:hypothetical protein
VLWTAIFAHLPEEHFEVVGAIIVKPLVSSIPKTLRPLNLLVSQILKLGSRQVQSTLGSRYYQEKSQSRPDKAEFAMPLLCLK